MAQIKAHEVDRYLNKPDPKHKTILIYGPDSGLVSERAAKLAGLSGSNLDDPFATIVLDAEDAASDPARIADEAHTVSMFGGERLVWIKGSTKKNLSAAVQPVLDQPPADSRIIIEAGDLKKSSPLRSRIEKSVHAVALPCFQDQARSIEAVIDEEMRKNKLTIDREAKQLLVSLLGGDRLASRGEVQKLCLYAANLGTISIDDVEAIVGDASVLAVDAVIDATAVGDVPTMEHMFKRLISQGTPVFQIIAAAQRHFQTLHFAKSTMLGQKQPASAVVNSLRPPINFKRKDKLVRALSNWQLPALEKALRRLEKTALETRQNSGLAISIASTTLLAITLEAKVKRQ